jgi:ComF family protein
MIRLKSILTPYLHRICDICAMTLKDNESFWCTPCQQRFLHQGYCRCCGLPMPKIVSHCGACLTQPPHWHRLYCLGDYQFPLSQEIQRIKYRRQFWRMPPLVELLAPRIEQPAPLITSVPLHWRRRWQRGFNQSDLLARQLAKTLPISYQPNLFSRVQATPYQRGLNRQQRLCNLSGAFRLNAQPGSLPDHIAICDDVVTTGTTVEQLCQLLLDVEVKRIDIYCLSRTAYD